MGVTFLEFLPSAERFLIFVWCAVFRIRAEKPHTENESTMLAQAAGASNVATA
jgi:hypothetical protein